jgi:predicted nucleotidyltransferase
MELLRKSYDYLASEYSVSKIAIFGSVVRGTMSEDSDVDILVEFSSPIGFRFNQLVEYLENLLSRKVDVMTRDGMKNIRIRGTAENIQETLVYV